jgi:von Willebrand factor A domain-containing protein 8
VLGQIDKAPLEVVAVLKSLLEDQDMLLADGRRLLGCTRLAMEGGPREGIVSIHPNFRLWALANRPGYPFLGNNFFRCRGHVPNFRVFFLVALIILFSLTVQ